MSRSPTSIYRRFRYGLSALAALLMGGCSYSYPIDAGFIGGKVAFSANEHSSGCLNYVEVKSEAGELMWRFEGPFQLSGCRNDFPLVYGTTPQSATASMPAKKLLPNIRYYIAASDGDSYYGSFRIRRVLSIESDPKRGHDGPYFNGALNGVDRMTEPAGNGS